MSLYNNQLSHTVKRLFCKSTDIVSILLVLQVFKFHHVATNCLVHGWITKNDIVPLKRIHHVHVNSNTMTPFNYHYKSLLSLHESMRSDDNNKNNSSDNEDLNKNMFNIFDSLQQFFLGNNNPLFNNPFFNANANNNEVRNVESPTTNMICTIPAQHVKKGGLRLFLMFYLMGMQNTPDRKTWRVVEMDQPYIPIATTSTSTIPVDNPLGIEYYFYDNSAVLTIVLESDMVRIERRLPTNGSIISQPSNSYMMQEAMIVEGILTELDQCAHDDTVPASNRLLLLNDSYPNSIRDAKEMLSFG